MKQTINISLGGCVFAVEEDAVEKLQRYIKTLEVYYQIEEGGKEIMNDIEARLAELFSDYQKKEHREYIVLTDIENVIRIMGTPNDIIDDNEVHESKKQKKRKFYRDADNRIIAGVAAGLAQWMDIPVIVIRIVLFVFLITGGLFGSLVIGYIICWIVVPKAITSAQKLEMQGEFVNINNIAKKATEMIQHNQISESLTTAFFIILRIFAVIVLSIASAALIAITTISIICIINGISPFFMEGNVGLGYMISTNISFYFTLAIPFFLLIWGSLSILKKGSHIQIAIPICMSIIWIISIILFVILIVTHYSYTTIEWHWPF